MTALCRSSRLNEVLRALYQYNDGHLGSADLARTVQAGWDFVRSTERAFEARLRLTPATPVLQAELPVLRNTFSALQTCLDRLKTAAARDDQSTLAAQAVHLQTGADTLYETLDRLAAEARSETVRFPRPFLHALWRLGQAATQGGSMEAFETCLAEAIARFEQNFDGPLSTEPGHGPWLAENGNAVREARKLVLFGLKEARTFLEDTDLAHVEKGLNLAQAALARLAALESRLLSADAPSGLHCPCCATVNALQSRHCRTCRTALRVA
jgi:hypothetical protein